MLKAQEKKRNVELMKTARLKHSIVAREKFPVLELCPIHVCGTESIDLHGLRAYDVGITFHYNIFGRLEIRMLRLALV